MTSEPKGGLSPELRHRLLEASPDELGALALERPELAQVVERLLSVNTEIALGLDDAPRAAGSERGARAVSWRHALPLGLAAAAVVAWLVIRPGAPGPPVSPVAPDLPPAWAPTGAELTSELAVETESDFAVFPTDDPDMAVVWIFNNGAD